MFLATINQMVCAIYAGIPHFSFHILRKTASALARLPTVTSQVEQQSPGDPEPAQTGHTAGKRKDDGIRQRCQRQKEHAQQRHNPASVKGAIDERCREPDHQQRDACKKRGQLSLSPTLEPRWRGRLLLVNLLYLTCPPCPTAGICTGGLDGPGRCLPWAWCPATRCLLLRVGI